MEYLPEIIIGVLSCAGTLIGSLAGIRKANELTNYRVLQLEKKVEKHNGLMDKTYQLQEDVAVLENRQSVSEHRIADLEQIGA